jgi:hypothetical protein
MINKVRTRKRLKGIKKEEGCQKICKELNRETINLYLGQWSIYPYEHRE